MTDDGIRWIAGAFDTYCLTFARGLEVGELVRRMGGDAGAIREGLSADEAMDWSDRKGLVARLGTCGGWAFALEHRSDEGMDRRTLRAVSRGTEAVVYLNAGAPPSWFLYAEDGRVVGDFEPGVEAAQLGGEDPGRLVPALQEVGLLLPDGTSAPGADGEDEILAMGERRFGLALPRDAVEHGTLAAVSFAPF
ncbi:DUF6461 domain-containing protein [Actinacidiphila glaucinigra]|uniref:DUF6461 domain-containing protein n=1 Tax=Actinacidiphila glaucinigra TaxID=235986 RepID=UPI002DD843FF|nr:DUF6461 domain-containing protein [Actinacidiphila glaucinigra]WSD61757.1 DUF6461 domain-containing protein [Actinacidiphila glaucinigra]